MMIAEKRLLLLEPGNQLRLLAVERPGLYEVRILEGEHYGKTALVPKKALRANPKQPK
jgi:hypothetical protein